jgi:uncharacterized protein (DUF302 family)
MKHGEGIVSRESRFSPVETLERVERVLQEKGIHIFARIDHAAGAAGVGLTMKPTWVVLFGNPKAGTPVMLAAPAAAIDLPLKALVWQDAHDVVWLSWNDPEYLRRRFGLTEDQIHPISGVGALLESALK